MRPRGAFAALAIFAAAMSLAPGAACADILFIDLNLSSSEVAAAREAARLRGEALVVIPEVPEPVRAKAQPLRREYADVHEALRLKLKELERAMNDPAKTAAQRAAIQEQAQVLNAKDDEALRRLSLAVMGYRISEKTLAAALKKQSDRGRVFKSVVVSGHHGIKDGQYSGALGSIASKQVFEEFRKVRGMSGAVRGAYLWGCYSATIEKVGVWLSAFPQMKVLSGFDGIAPAEGRTQSTEYLRTSLEDEPKFSAEPAPPGVLRAVEESVKQAKESGGMNAAVCVASCYVTPKGVTPLSRMRECDPALKRQGAEGHAEFRRYLYASDRAHLDVPADTGKSALRTYYTFLRQFSHCRQLKTYRDDADVAIRLILSRDITRNFGLRYASEIASLNRTLTTARERPFLDLTAGLRPPSRAAVLREIIRLEAVAKRLRPKNKPPWHALFRKYGWKPQDPDERPADQVAEFAGKMRRLIGQLECVPVSWAEPVGRVEDLEYPNRFCLMD